MAEVHRTTLSPGKLELLAEWLPGQRWYVGKGRVPQLRRLGGFRLDDPRGQVGVEILIVSDHSAPQAVVYQIPLTFRDAPLDGADAALVGTAEHGVLGRRWVYDATHDPVFVGELLALIQGTAVAQHQSESNTPDPTVVGHHVAGPQVTLVSSSVLRGEQSNTSIICTVREPAGEPAEPIIIKVFRTLQAGDNPDVTVQSALTEAGSTQVPATIGSASGRWLSPDHVEARQRHEARIDGHVKAAVDARTRVVERIQRDRDAAAAEHAAERARVARQRALEINRRREVARPTLHDALLGDKDRLDEASRVRQDDLPDPDAVQPPEIPVRELPRIPAHSEFAEFVPEVVGGHLAFAQRFFPGVEDAWRVALRAATTGTDFTAAARELGEATAHIHVSLARALGTTPPSEGARRELVGAVRARYFGALGEVPALAVHERAIHRVIDELDRHEWADLQRVHGDYHLGQVLHVPDRGWVAVDFEGEPLRPLSERVRPDLALRDVAGMLRSFDYAGGSVELGHPGVSARAWVQECRVAFLDGYASVARLDLAAAAPVIRALELDKALYEVVYEARNRPTWLGIPTTAIDRLIAESKGSS